MLTGALYQYIVARPVLLGSIAAGLASVSYGTTHFIARLLVTEKAPPLVVATFALLSGLVLLGTISHRSLIHDRRAPRSAFLNMALAGIAASSGVAVSFYALSIAPVTVIAPVISVTPLISLVLAHLFLKRLERITRRMWIGSMMVVAGVILVSVGAA